MLIFCRKVPEKNETKHISRSPGEPILYIALQTAPNRASCLLSWISSLALVTFPSITLTIRLSTVATSSPACFLAAMMSMILRATASG